MGEEPGPSVESEITLAIVSDRPAAEAQSIAEVKSIEGYFLSGGHTEIFQDIYLDSMDCALGKCRWALRLRLEPSAIRIALKGPARLAEHGGLERPEIDVPWSREALYRLAGYLSPLGIKLDADRFLEDDPEQTLAALGLRVIQRRLTRRTKKDIVNARGTDVIAEMAIDCVTYRFPSGEVNHWEVEIEALCTNGLPALTIVAERLMSQFGKKLRIWNYGKLATGTALRNVLQAETPARLVSEDRVLRPEAYDRIEAFLLSAAAGGISHH